MLYHYLFTSPSCTTPDAEHLAFCLNWTNVPHSDHIHLPTRENKCIETDSKVINGLLYYLMQCCIEIWLYSLYYYIYLCTKHTGQHINRQIPAAARSKAWVRGCSFAGNAGSNPVGGGMNVSFECCVLSGRGLRVGLITRPEESYRDSCIQWVWSWSHIRGSHAPESGRSPKGGKGNI